MYLKSILAIAIISLTSLAYGQPKKVKFGKVDKEDLEMTVYPLDTTASAVILSDIGKSSFSYDAAQGVLLIYSRHLRIKILTTSGYDYANHDIKFYTPSGTDEKVGQIKGLTHNMVEGKVVSTKLTKDGIFEERTNKTTKKKKITMPDVKVGSVVELKYVITTPYWKYLRNWQFQHQIPTRWSQYSVTTSEYFHYNRRIQGYLTPFSSSKKDAIGDEALGRMTREEFAFKDIPAFVEEPYMTSKNDYIEKVIYELSGVTIPGRVYKDYTSSWDEVKNTYLESSTFTGAVKAAGFTKNLAATLTLGLSSDEEKMVAIMNHLKSKMKWNGYNSDYVPTTLKKAYEAKEGNAAEINLLLVALLQRAGIKAYPILLSTRSNGFVRTMSPNSDQFNYVLCQIDLGDGFQLLDATDYYLPHGMIPQRCLNGKGLVISKTRTGWVNLNPSRKNSSKTSAKFILSEEGELEGNIKKSYGGYYALNRRKKIQEIGEDTYIDNMIEKSEWELENVSISALSKIDAPIEISYDSYSDGEGQGALGTIYLNPILVERRADNPFKTEKRVYPVDFACPFSKSYMAQITIPDGYAIVEMPEAKVIALPNNAGKYTYQLIKNNNTITVISKMSIKKALFVQNEYPYLRAFYEQMLAKQAEQIILKKIK